MKKNYFLLFIILTSFTSNLFSQIRYVQVDPATNVVTIQNFGASTVDISGWWICHLFSYDQLSNGTVNSGSLNLAPGAQVNLTLGQNLNAASSDLGLYETPSFGSASAMRDFIQWGASGQGRENVANSAGIWASGTFLSVAVTPPYVYVGNGMENGITFWDSLLSTDDFSFKNNLSLAPNPNRGEFTIYSRSSSAITKIKIYNLLGNLVYQKNTGQVFNLDLNMNLKTGIYLVEIFSRNKKTIKRIVLE